MLCYLHLQAEKIPFSYDMSFEELAKVQVSILSSFEEEQLGAASNVHIFQASESSLLNLRYVDDYFNTLPGVTTLQDRAGSSIILVRGVANTIPRGIANLWDGVDINSLTFNNSQYFVSNIDLFTLDQIQFVKGPASSVYGADAHLGAVSYESYKSYEKETLTTIESSTDDFHKIGFKTSQPLGEHHYLNLALAYNQRENREIPITFLSSGNTVNIDSEQETDNFTAVLKVHSDDQQDFSYELAYYLNYWNNNVTIDPALENSQPSLFFDINVDDNNTLFHMLRFSTNYKIDEVSSVETKSYAWSFDSQRFFHGPGTLLDREDVDENSFGSQVTYKRQLPKQKTQLALSYAVRFQEIKGFTVDFFDRDPTPFLLNRNETANRLTHSVFLDGKTQIYKDKFALSYGYRLDYFKTYDLRDTLRLGLVWKIDDTSALKWIYSEGYRPPTGILEERNTDSNIEEVTSYEMIYSKFSENYKFEATIFLLEYEDGLIDGGVNANSTDNFGIELSSSYKLGNYFADLSGSVIDTQNRSVVDNNQTFPSIIVNTGIGYQAPSKKYLVYLNSRLLHDMDSTRSSQDQLNTFFQVNFHSEYRMDRKTTFWFNIKNLLGRNNTLPSATNNLNGVLHQEPSASVGVTYQF